MVDFTTFLGLAVPVAVGITKFTDLIRNGIDPNDRAPKLTWNLVPFALGLLVAFLFPDQTTQLVVATGVHVGGTAATILVGLALGGMAGFWHEPLSAWSARSGVTEPKP